MRNFEFHRPSSVDDAVALLKANEAAKLLAGGQSLLPVMKLDLAQPSDLVSLAGLPGLGREAVLAITTQDLPVIIGVVILASVFVVVASILVDVGYAVLDPRVRVH